MSAYSQYGSPAGAPPPALSNNPFIDHPNNALSKYPDINTVDQATGGQGQQFTSWLSPSSPGVSSPTGGYSGFGPSSAQYQQPQQQQQQTGWQGGGVGGSGYPQQSSQTGYAGGYGGGQQFQPTSSFGQQLNGQLNGYPQPPQQQQYASGTGYPQQSPQYGSGFGYGQQPQQFGGAAPQPQFNQQYLSEFDPLTGRSGQFQGGQNGSITGGSSIPSGVPGSSQYRDLHPREFVQRNKTELEAWDTYAWKQVINSFDALKNAWSARKVEIEARSRSLGGQGLFGGGGYGYGNYGQAQQVQQLEQLVRQAETNADTVAAASFQMQEVHSGYRQSGDLASKKRVREAINAALQSLPDWPPQNW